MLKGARNLRKNEFSTHECFLTSVGIFSKFVLSFKKKKKINHFVSPDFPPPNLNVYKMLCVGVRGRACGPHPLSNPTMAPPPGHYSYLCHSFHVVGTCNQARGAW